MPSKPLRPCKHAGCRALTSATYCSMHQPKREETRQTSAQRGYTYRWHKESRQFLITHPWCVYCEEQHRLTPATEVDHLIPHKGNPILFWDKNNWRATCHSCHSSKTAREDGGFGNTTPHPKKK